MPVHNTRPVPMDMSTEIGGNILLPPLSLNLGQQVERKRPHPNEEIAQGLFVS